MTQDILSYFPAHLTPRQEQIDLLLELQESWNSFDVAVVTAPTALGKTEIAVTLAAWSAANKMQATYVVPNNILVEQTSERYPTLAVMSRQDSYEDMDEFVAARRAVKKAGVRLANSYTYWAYRLASPTVIFDEAHQLVDMLADVRDIKLWQKQYKFPGTFKTVADVIEWGQKRIAAKGGDVRLEKVLAEIVRVRKGATIEYRESFYKGEVAKVLHVVPTLAGGAPPWLWPYGKVRKIIMLSATINEQDIKELGLNTRRVKYLECSSPIPAERRQIIFKPVCNMAFQYVDKALPVLAAFAKKIMAHHPEKGLIHLPYKLAEQFADLMDDPRIMSHDHGNKAEMLELFRASPPEEGRVLIASGMYEGVDLPYDAARWQIIGKVPFLNLGSEPIRARAAEEPGWYAWETIKRLIQASGRIVRAADDHGYTYIGDTNFLRLYTNDLRRERPMFPKFIRDAVRIRSK